MNIHSHTYPLSFIFYVYRCCGESKMGKGKLLLWPRFFSFNRYGPMATHRIGLTFSFLTHKNNTYTYTQSQTHTNTQIFAQNIKFLFPKYSYLCVRYRGRLYIFGIKYMRIKRIREGGFIFHPPAHISYNPYHFII